MDLENVEIREVSPDPNGSSDDEQGTVVLKRGHKTITVIIQNWKTFDLSVCTFRFSQSLSMVEDTENDVFNDEEVEGVPAVDEWHYISDRMEVR